MPWTPPHPLQRRTEIRPTAGRVPQRITPDASLQEVLDLEPDEALLRIERVTSQSGRVIECRLTLLRSNRMAGISDWPGAQPHAGSGA